MNTRAALFDPKTERAVAGACIGADGYLEALLKQGFATEYLSDFHAKAALEAAMNLRARGEQVRATTVRAELEATGYQDLAAWFPAVVDLPAMPPLALVQSWGRNIAATRVETEQQIAEHDQWRSAFTKALADVQALLAVKHERKPLFTTDAVQLLAREFDGARWLVTGLVTRGGVVIVGGEPKTAKTWVATELAVALATGTKTFGEFYAEHGHCAYFYAEDLDVQVRNRVRALLAGAERRLEAGRLHLQPRGTFIDVLVDDDLAWLVTSVRQIGAVSVLVLDPLRDVHSGEEDKSDSMRNVMRRLRVLAELLGCAVVVVHHAVKSNKDNAGRRPGQNLRGSSAIHGAMDCGLFVTEPDGNGVNVFTATVTSQVKGARSAGTFELELRVTDDGAGEALKAEWTFSNEVGKHGEADDDVRERNNETIVLAWLVAQPPRSKTSIRDSFKAIGLPRNQVTKTLDRLLSSGQAELSGGYVAVRDPGQDRTGATC